MNSSLPFIRTCTPLMYGVYAWKNGGLFFKHIRYIILHFFFRKLLNRVILKLKLFEILKSNWTMKKTKSFAKKENWIVSGYNENKSNKLKRFTLFLISKAIKKNKRAYGSKSSYCCVVELNLAREFTFKI